MKKKNNVSSLRKGKREREREGKEKENTNSLTNISGNLKLFQVEISLLTFLTLKPLIIRNKLTERNILGWGFA